MNPTLSKLCRFLKSERREVREAAAVLIGELGTSERRVSQAIIDAMKNADEATKVRLLGSISKIPSISYLPCLVPLLQENGAVRDRAFEAVILLGKRAFPYIKNRYYNASQAEKRNLLSIMARLKSREALVFLIDCLPNSDFELLKFICFTIKTQKESYGKEERNILLKHIHKVLTPAYMKRHSDAFISCLILIGALGDPLSKKKLLLYARPKFQPRIRKYALMALSELRFKEKGDDKVIRELLPYLKENDFFSVGKFALDTLGRLPIPKRLGPAMQDLLKNPQTSVREFALSRMGDFNDRSGVQALLSNFESNDFKLREAARLSLEKMTQAVPVILKRIEETKEIEKARNLASLLRSQRGYFKAEKARGVFKIYQKLMEKQDERLQVYLTLLRLVNPDILYGQTMSVIRELKNKKRFAEARRYLANLQGGPLFTQDARFEMALAELKLSKKDVGLSQRDADPAIRLFAALVHNSLSFAVERLRKERSLDVEDLYYLGFHFAEKLFELKDFGIQILKMLIRKYPRSRCAASAKKKLSAVGTATGGGLAPVTNFVAKS
ncbi:MAG: HEAT repeat domain-containing protein [Candidatus Omnitrophica bacterium]|nr:HEAT repeat domain-containing protein [Candidatus Omnitrophota bacterium]